MFKYIKSLFASKVAPTEVDELEKQIRGEVNGGNQTYPYDKELDELIQSIIKNPAEDVIVGWNHYKLAVELTDCVYVLWIANYPYGYLTEVWQLKNKAYWNTNPSNTIFRSKSPGKETIIKFEVWFRRYKEQMEEYKALANLISGKKWESVVENYRHLKLKHHYSHHTVRRYMDEVIKLKEDSAAVMSEDEVNKLLSPHIVLLDEMAHKAKVELDNLLEEQKRKEQEETERKKDNYKKALVESSELLLGRYEGYCRDFGLDK